MSAEAFFEDVSIEGPPGIITVVPAVLMERIHEDAFELACNIPRPSLQNELYNIAVQMRFDEIHRSRQRAAIAAAQLLNRGNLIRVN